MSRGKKVHYVDFDKLEGSSYKTLSRFSKEIVEKMVELSSGEKLEITSEVQAKIDLILEGLKLLTKKQQRVLELTFGLNENPALTEQEIADELKISQQGVHQLKKRALRTLSQQVILNEDAVKGIEEEKK